MIQNVFGKKLDNIEYFERLGVYGICINSENKIAVIKTARGFFLPGGGIERSETHIECLKREFIEETGYEIQLGEYIGTASLYHTSRTNQHIYGVGYFYFVDLMNKIHNGIEDDHEMIWLEPNKCIDSLMLVHQAWAISEVMKIKSNIE